MLTDKFISIYNAVLLDLLLVIIHEQYASFFVLLYKTVSVHKLRCLSSQRAIAFVFPYALAAVAQTPFSSMEAIAYSLPCVTPSGFPEIIGHLHLPNKPWNVYLGSCESCSFDNRYLHTYVFHKCSSSYIFYINRKWLKFARLQWRHKERD